MVLTLGSYPFHAEIEWILHFQAGSRILDYSKGWKRGVVAMILRSKPIVFAPTMFVREDNECADRLIVRPVR